MVGVRWGLIRAHWAVNNVPKAHRSVADVRVVPLAALERATPVVKVGRELACRLRLGYQRAIWARRLLWAWSTWLAIALRLGLLTSARFSTSCRPRGRSCWITTCPGLIGRAREAGAARFSKPGASWVAAGGTRAGLTRGR